MRKYLPLTISCVAGLAVGWSVACRHQAQHKAEAAHQPLQNFIRHSDPISVYRPRVPGDVGIELAPISVQQGASLTILGDGPADPQDVVLISFNHGEAVISCKRVK